VLKKIHILVNICGFIDDYTTGENGYILGEKVLGTTKDLTSILSECEVDEIIIALANSQYEKINRLIDECEYHGVKTQIIPDYFHIIPAKPFFDELDDIPLITTRYVPLDDGMNSFLKRLFDIIISAMILIFLSPLLLVIAIGVRVSSPGPIIYRQKRIGLHRKEFEIYKFRSMRVNDGGWTTKEDPRKTKFGAFIRRTSIDELPQFVNVLKGDMSIIGPRPEQPKYVWEFKEEIPKYMIKHHVRPGITGWAQVNGWRGDTSIKERIKCDVEYIEKWSIWFDVKIFFMTFKAMFKNAY
jgi:Undecaprenyl-phosphate glucose phosphotransferase